MPFSPALDRALRPVALATLAAGLLTALAASVSHAAAPTAASGHPPAYSTVGHPAPDPVTPGAAAAAPARPVARTVTRSYRRGEWIRPVAGPVTSPFGRRWGGFHPGIDIGAHYGARVRAITTGRIISAGWIPGYGKTVRVRAGRYTFFYPHLSRILRRHGIIREGDVLGRVGSTGFSTGPHLHVEIRVHGRPINPAPLLRRHGVRL